MILNTPVLTDRRRDLRAEVSWPVVLLTNRGVTVGETKNIGMTGAFIVCSTPLAPEERFRLFVMPPNHKPLNISVEVTWANPYCSEDDILPGGVGIRFVRVSPNDRQFLRNAIAGIYERAASRNEANR